MAVRQVHRVLPWQRVVQGRVAGRLDRAVLLLTMWYAIFAVTFSCLECLIGSSIAAQIQQSLTVQVTINERDPNWLKARELTDAAEKASKISAAKVSEDMMGFDSHPRLIQTPIADCPVNALTEGVCSTAGL